MSSGKGGGSKQGSSDSAARSCLRGNVAIIGHVDHGKTTLTSAMTKVAYDLGFSTKNPLKLKDIDKTKEEQERGITIVSTQLELTTGNLTPQDAISVLSKGVLLLTQEEASSLTEKAESLKKAVDSGEMSEEEASKKLGVKVEIGFSDCPGHSDYIKNMITASCNSDVGVLVVSATDGKMVQTTQHVHLCSQVGIPNIIVVVNKCDSAEQEITDLVKEEVADLLISAGYDGDSTVIEMSALSILQDSNSKWISNMKELFLAINKKIVQVAVDRDISGPFKMSISNVYTVKGVGTIVAGLVVRGSIKKGGEVTVVSSRGLFKRYTTTVVEMQTFHSDLEQAHCGFNLAVRLRSSDKNLLRRGDCLVTPGSLTSHSMVKAIIYMLTPSEGGRNTAVSTGYSPSLVGISGSATTGKLILEEDLLMPGQHATVKFEFRHPIPVEKDDTFALREGNKTIGAGRVVEVCE